MRIALCDDERKENEHLRALIEEYAQKKDYDIQCEAFTTDEKLLEKDRFDLYFLDYIMDGMSGLETAQALNEKFNRAVTVCYLTNYESAAAEIINGQVYADGFLRKPVEPALLYEKLDKFYKTSFLGRLELKQGRSLSTVYTRDVLYFEAEGKKSIAHFGDRDESYSHMLSELETILAADNTFFRIHRSFIVNLTRVVSYDAKTVTLSNGETLPLKSKNFQQAYRNFIYAQMK